MVKAVLAKEDMMEVRTPCRVSNGGGESVRTGNVTDVIRQKKYRKGTPKVEGVVSRGETDADRRHTAQIESIKASEKLGETTNAKQSSIGSVPAKIFF